MADLVLLVGQSVPQTAQFVYKDMGDGTHAQLVELRATASGGNDIVLSSGQSIPESMSIRYAEQPDGTLAPVKAV